ncbi:YrhB domain-containing protein [Streptomyces sp. NPDC056975]|uniref:YrhB domain-containing protein n=1 Tax=Streptomyces sp. NPDC056975 TaxID=3345985 RepID=UPI00364203E9
MESMRLAVVHVEQHELVWLISRQSEESVRTRNWRYGLAGNGPYRVDRLSGGVHQIGVLFAKGGDWEVDSGARARVRGRKGGPCVP